jgi:creatinine amidohydrolase/Fe(II)-dependent formamide hydrolase-like protein
MKRILPLYSLGFLCAAQGPAPVRLELMTYPEVYMAIHAQGKTTVPIFNGGTEQRGPHAVLGGHTFIAAAIAEGIARKLGNALVAPVFPFSPTDNFLKPQWPGTISVSPDLYAKVNEAMVGSMVVAGFKNIVLLAEHGGGEKELEELARILDAKYSPQGTHVFFCGATLTKGRDEFNAILKQKNLPVSTHGGIPDTSELMYLGCDKYVRMDKIVAGDPVLAPGQKHDPGLPLINNGIQGDPRGSTPELGKLDIDIKVAVGAEEIRKLISPR